MASSRDDFIIAIRSAFLKKSTQQKFSLLTLVFISIFTILLSSLDFKAIRYLKIGINELVYRSSFVVSIPENFIKDSFYEVSDYITINISSPNTPGLRKLQEKRKLQQLLHAIKNLKIKLSKDYNRKVPFVLKISPDIDPKSLDYILQECVKHKFKALIISNTSLNKKKSYDKSISSLNGGLSGKPLFKISNELLEKAFKKANKRVQLIGVGGILDTENIISKINYGADAVQVYSGLIFKGSTLVDQALLEMNNYMRNMKFEKLSELKKEKV